MSQEFDDDERTESLEQFLRDSADLRTKVEHRWSAWMDNREDGIVGTGETEEEAIINLAKQI